MKRLRANNRIERCVAERDMLGRTNPGIDLGILTDQLIEHRLHGLDGDDRCTRCQTTWRGENLPVPAARSSACFTCCLAQDRAIKSSFLFQADSPGGPQRRSPHLRESLFLPGDESSSFPACVETVVGLVGHSFFAAGAGRSRSRSPMGICTPNVSDVRQLAGSTSRNSL